jgi:predicted NAD/FAD-dependent oxidoreductase
MTEIASFKKQTYGAVVATILETDNSIVEVTERNDGVYGLTIHTRRNDSDRWDDLTAYLTPRQFELLGTVAKRMES